MPMTELAANELYLTDAQKVKCFTGHTDTATHRLSNRSGLRLAKVFAILRSTQTHTHSDTMWSFIWAAGQVINIYISSMRGKWYLYLSDTLLRLVVVVACAVAVRSRQTLTLTA